MSGMVAALAVAFIGWKLCRFDSSRLIEPPIG
jgi:hypothetical protein